MNSAICTLFEGHYHYGVASLSNSLYAQGFRGNIYAGYRGELPDWVQKGKKESIGKWKDAIILNPVEDLRLIFLPLTTTYSLTNYKPDFMLELWEDVEKNAESFFYFDPDIVVADPWPCFKQWIHCGVAVCEDVDSPFQEFHPRRVGWRNYFKKYNVELKFKSQVYVNGGCVGVLKKDKLFLTLWMQLQKHMGEAIGGLENSIFSNLSYKSTILKMEGFTFFDKSDQDALNATVEAYDGTVSFLGKEGMGFEMKHITMYHALGSPKPWKAQHFIRIFQGRIPRKEDEKYWENAEYPIKLHSNRNINQKKIAIKIAKFIGRFYRI